ncbi:MAG: inorganic phosphate transporter, partial [Candidatus Xenobia bacterium]
VISTRVLSPRAAILMAGALDLLGALLGTHVAKTISSGIVGGEVPERVVLTALLGAITWNLITWYFGIPSSSSHALIGGVIGAVIANGLATHLNVPGILDKVILPLVLSPTVGLLMGFAVMLTIMWTCQNALPSHANTWFRRLQLCSSASMGLSHGFNDAQKSMGIITMALISARLLPLDASPPLWVILACAVSMGIGTATGGWRIIRTMGSRIIKLQPVHGFAAEVSAATVIFTAGAMGAPVSTTHVIAGSIMGVGATRRLSAVRWGVAGSMVVAWVLTIPAAATVAGILCLAAR